VGDPRDESSAASATARKYARLKYHLADRFRSDCVAYTEAKITFISETLRGAT
jgi:GrpB-like predicted nucleotidyltransferase (UPF0157 family)